jgi:signal transduction histidine kinase
VITGDAALQSEGQIRSALAIWAALLLASRRGEILGRWIEAVSQQPVHRGRWDHTITEALPQVFDALAKLVQQGTRGHPVLGDATDLRDAPTLVEAARAHAMARSAQGVTVTDLLDEFRFLRHEIRRAIHDGMDEIAAGGASGAGLVAVETLVSDLLSTASAAAVSAFVYETETTRDDLLAGAVHELRQVLTSVKGNIQYASRALGGRDDGGAEEHDAEDLRDRRRLAEGGASVRRAEEALRRADTTTDQLTALLNTLVEASQLASARYPIQPATADLAEVVRSALAEVGPELAVSVDVPPDTDTSGRWDASALRRAVTTLLLNALAYSPAASRVEINIHTERASATKEDVVHLEIRDRGMGLAPEDLSRLFHRYGRTNSMVEHKVPGLGLGLYLARGIVEAHGGHIWAESLGPGYGTTVHMTLPRFAPPAPPAV